MGSGIGIEETMKDHAKFVKRIEREPENDSPNLMMAIDEIVTGPVDMVHVERMDDGTYWMGLYKGKHRQVVTFHSKNCRAKIFARTECDS
jgi:hypothetical protein